jgi:hypothetical protein
MEDKRDAKMKLDMYLRASYRKRKERGIEQFENHV